MANLFVTLTSIVPLVSQVLSTPEDRLPGVNTTMKDGVLVRNTLDPTGPVPAVPGP